MGKGTPSIAVVHILGEKQVWGVGCEYRDHIYHSQSGEKKEDRHKIWSIRKLEDTQRRSGTDGSTRLMDIKPIQEAARLFSSMSKPNTEHPADTKRGRTTKTNELISYIDLGVRGGESRCHTTSVDDD